ncbi:hypothetical protein Tco_0686471 [Tanacetum coccineum]
MRKFRENTDLDLKIVDVAIKNLDVKVEQLTQEICAYMTNEDNAVDQVKAEEVKEVKKEPVPHNLPIVNPYVEPYVPPIPFMGSLKKYKDEAQAFKVLEDLKGVKINRLLIRAIKRMPELISSDKEKQEVHWCEPIEACNEESDQLWASCDPCTDKCDSKTIREDIRNLWAYSYDDERIKILWKDMPFSNWVKFRYGNVGKVTERDISNDCILESFPVKLNNNEEVDVSGTGIMV